MARSLAALLGAGAAFGAVALATRAPGGHASTGAVTGVLVAAALLAMLLLRDVEGLTPRAFQLVLACATLLLTGGIAAMGGRPGIAAMLYVWIVLYAGFFFSPAAAAVQVVAVACADAVVMLSRHGAGATTAWFGTVAVIAVAAVLVVVVRRRLERAVGGLAMAAVTDPLTGLLNRGGFNERFAAELDRAIRTGRPLAVLLADLDHFKQANDRLGHAGGDAALRKASTILSRGKRRIDTVGRIGGEEFALLVPESDRDGGRQLAERLRVEIAHAFAGNRVALTISIGVAAFPRDGRDSDDLLRAADEALYAAKEGGRNRVMVAGEQGRRAA
jgi:diguanylate cyclase (GGDEF)-like protein